MIAHTLRQRTRKAWIKTRRAALKPFVGWCNRNLSQRNLEWISAHSFGWIRLVPRPVRIPGTPYMITDVKVTQWVSLASEKGDPA